LLLLLEEPVLLGLEVEPPLEVLFCVSLELEELAGLDGVLLIEPDADEEDGLDGVLVEPDADVDDGLDGEVLLEGALLAPRDALLPLRSQPVTSAVPRARDTARARVENLMGPPWLGYMGTSARNGPVGRRPSGEASIAPHFPDAGNPCAARLRSSRPGR
jgi:hypothetical protein